MHDAVADKFRIGQRRDHGKDPLLLPEPQMGLEADHIIDRPGGIVLPQLDDGIGLPPRGRVRQADGLERAVA